jgi:hypothetical protein
MPDGNIRHQPTECSMLRTSPQRYRSMYLVTGAALVAGREEYVRVQ